MAAPACQLWHRSAVGFSGAGEKRSEGLVHGRTTDDRRRDTRGWFGLTTREATGIISPMDSPDQLAKKKYYRAFARSSKLPSATEPADRSTAAATFRGLRRVAVMAGMLTATVACGSAPGPEIPTRIALAAPQGGGSAYVEVIGIPGGTLAVLDSVRFTHERWAQVLRVAVDSDASPMLGSYAVVDDALRFTPSFPFDEGRQYEVRFDPGAVPGARNPVPPVVEARVGLPASTAVPSTEVSRAHPSGDAVPESRSRRTNHSRS